MGAKVVVLGAGVGGSVAARELRRLLPAEHRVTVVERVEQLVLGASLLRVIVGERRPDELVRPVAALSRQGIEVLAGDVARIDPARRQVEVAGRTLEADHLVIALGAELDPSGVPGLSSAGHSFYTLEGAAALRDAVAGLGRGRLVVLTAAPAYKCPAAPYEAALLMEWGLRRRAVRERVSLEVYAAEPAPMGVAGPKVSAAVRDLLAAKGIAYHPDHQVVRADPAARRLWFSNGAEAEYDVLAFVAPHRAPRVVREAGLTSETGWIAVDRATLRTRFEGVWAVGDVTGIPLKMGRPLPKAATFAAREAEVVARAIAAELAGGPAPDAYVAIGECWVETGDGVAAHGHGDFFADPVPAVSLESPSADAHRSKEAWEREWLERWG